MNIAFFWTWEFSKNVLEKILQIPQIKVSLVVSQIDKPVWRKQELLPTEVKKFALENNLELMQVEKLKEESFLQKLKNLNLDFIVVVAYWKIIPIEILQIPKYNCINIHWSILPNYRWASPIQESIKNWDKKTWITIMEMSAWMDEWNIFWIKEVEIWFYDTTADIFKKFENFSAQFLYEILSKIIKNEIKSIPQDNSKATYCKKISKQDWQIDFENEKWIQIFNKYKAFYSWPWIYSYYKWKKIDFTQIDFEENNSCFDEDFCLWDVVEYEDHWVCKIAILANWWLIILHKIKLEWKKEMSISDFINWNKDFLEYNFLKN